jgi:hydrophobic/amphiphilic exporter-1 (mainly G- bacteria), HAE1 family
MRSWSLSDLALARPVTFGMALVAVILVGIIGFTQMPLSFLPLREQPILVVRVTITRTSPEVLERDVIRPLEDQIAGIRDLERIQVGSGSWGVRMNLEFRPETDLDGRKIELRDRIERVRPLLPEFVQNVEIEGRGSSDDPMMELQISSGTDLSGDYYLIEEKVVRRIERIPGVARVELDGVARHELEVAVDLESASRVGVALEDVSAVVRGARQGKSLGVLRDGATTPGVRSPAEAADPQRIAELPLRRGMRNVQATELAAQFADLGEVARVTVHPEEARRGRRLNGRRAVNLEVFSQAGASAVEVSRRIRAELEQLGNDPALDGIDLLVFRDQGETILATLGDLRNTGIYGGILGVAILFGFLHRWRTTIAAAISIPLSVCAAGAVLFLRGSELNCIVMLGLVLAVGMLIDNAVVIVEAIAQHIQRGADAMTAARLGAREVGFATIASTLSTVIVFLPIMFTPPRDRVTAYLPDLGSTFTITLVASLLVSQTAIPLLMGHILKPRPRPIRARLVEGLSAGYGWVVGRTIRWPRLTLVLGLVFAATAVYPAMNLNVRLGATEEEVNNLPIRMEIAGSKGYESIERTVVVLEDALLEHREEIAAESISCSYSDHWGNCRVYPARAFQSEAEVEAFKANVAKILPEQVGVTYRLGERDFDWRENTDRNVVEFALKGEDMGELIELSERVAAHLRGRLRKGSRDEPEAGGYDTITTPFDEGSREIHVQLDGPRLRTLGLDADLVATRVSLAFQGLPLGSVRGPRGDVNLRLSALVDEADADAGMALLRDLRLPLVDGGEVPLASVARIEIARRPWWIQRVDRQTEARVKVRFFTNDVGENWDVVGEALSDFAFPPGYQWGRGTQWKKQEEAGNEMLVNLGLCLLLVYAVMASLFESTLHPLGILLTCLLGCFGAPWALWITNTTLDATAVVGFFILIGVVVNNGIMLVDKVTQLRAQGVLREEALVTAGRQRLRPILMTMSTTVLGLVPMLIHHPTLAGIYYHSVALVVAGGLLTSTIITLLFLPSAYTILESVSQSAQLAWRHAFGLGRRARSDDS